MTEKKEVLIVDDDPAIVEALSLMLEDAGYATRTLGEGETLEALQENLPGVILLDVWMSGRDGRDICRYLKSQPATQHVSIIFISAHNHVQRFTEEAGADGYLAKPFSMKEVLATVGKYLAS